MRLIFQLVLSVLVIYSMRIKFNKMDKGREGMKEDILYELVFLYLIWF